MLSQVLMSKGAIFKKIFEKIFDYYTTNSKLSKKYINNQFTTSIANKNIFIYQLCFCYYFFRDLMFKETKISLSCNALRHPSLIILLIKSSDITVDKLKNYITILKAT